MPITASPVLPEPHVLETDLGRALPLFASVNWHDTVTSTNQLLMAQVRQPSQHSAFGWPRLMGAHHQTAGRGRAGRPWKEDDGHALMFSCGFKTELTLPQLAGLAPALGIASAEVVREHLLAAGASPDVCRTVQVKWPNDLMFGDAKLAGILVESVVRQEQQAQSPKPATSLYLVAGLGLNLTGHQQLSTQLGRAVADLSQAGVVIDLVGLVTALASAWLATLDTLACEGFTPFVDRIKPIDYLRDKMINVMQQDVVIKTGSAQGVTGQGALALQLASGVVEPVMVGDVSVRWQSPEALHKGCGGKP